MHDVHFSSETVEWATPQYLFDELNREFGFTLDPCATPENAKCDKFYTIHDDGLVQDWSGETVYVNPPYGRKTGDWIEKAIVESRKGSTVVCLIPAKTETRWWARFWDYERHRPVHGVQVRFIFKRVKFGESKINAPFPCAVVIFRGKESKR